MQKKTNNCENLNLDRWAKFKYPILGIGSNNVVIKRL